MEKKQSPKQGLKKSQSSKKESSKKTAVIPIITLHDVIVGSKWVDIEKYLKLKMKEDIDIYEEEESDFLKDTKAAYWDLYNMIPVPIPNKVCGNKKPSLHIILDPLGYYLALEIVEEADFTNYALGIENWIWLNISKSNMNMPYPEIAAIMIKYLTDNEKDNEDENDY